MDFGKVDDISKVDYTLPEDNPSNLILLKGLKKKKTKPKVYVGCAKWGRPDWIGTIYPKGTKASDFLAHYVKHFNSIELNALFYQLFSKTVVQKWADLADDDFRFSPKFSNVITHIRRLKNAEKETDAFLETINTFGPKLGTSFIQLGDNFSPKHYESVHAYLKSLPRDLDVAIEFRHTDWFGDNTIAHETTELLQELGITWATTDTSGRRDVLHSRLTTPKAFVRFVGNSLHPTDYKRIDDWVERIAYWLDNGVQTIYFYIHQHEELTSPILAKYVVEKLNKRCNLDLTVPKLLKDVEPPTLF